MAEKHRQDLERKTGQSWRITERRRADGAFSSHGHTFYFESAELLKEWLVTRTAISGGRKRVLDLYVVAATRERAIELVLDRVLSGHDDKGYNLVWAQRLTWTEEFATEFEHGDEEKETPTSELVEVH